MSEKTNEVAEQPTKTRKPRATAKVADQTKVVRDVKVTSQESTVINEDGQKVIAGSVTKPSVNPYSNLKPKDEGGAISSKAADRALSKPPVKKEDVPQKKTESKIAIWSSKNIRWTGVGTLTKGYNIVTEEAAEKWLSREGIRKATPEEVATYYGK